MTFILINIGDIRSLSADQLEYIPKRVLLEHFADYIHHVWVRLPNHMKFDPEIQTYRFCYEHWNRPNQRTHIDGQPPTIKNCSTCAAEGMGRVY